MQVIALGNSYATENDRLKVHYVVNVLGICGIRILVSGSGHPRQMAPSGCSVLPPWSVKGKAIKYRMIRCGIKCLL